MNLADAQTILSQAGGGAQRADAFAQERLAPAYLAAAPAEQARIRDAIAVFWQAGAEHERFLAHEFYRTIDCPDDVLAAEAQKAEPRADAILADQCYRIPDAGLHALHSAFVAAPLDRLTLAPLAVVAEHKLGLPDEALPLLLRATATVTDVKTLRRVFEAFVVPSRDHEFLDALRARSPQLLAELKTLLPPTYEAS